jgi:aminodeoxyfutalosine deaminase
MLLPGHYPPPSGRQPMRSRPTGGDVTDAGAAGGPRVEHARLTALPKVELHVHLEGTIAAATAAGLASARGEDPASVLVLDPERTDGPHYPHPFRDFLHFVDTFVASSAQVQEPSDLTTVAAAFAAGQAAQRIRWSEATFTAVTMEMRGWDAGELWEALLRGLATAPQAGIGLILDTPRDLGPEVARRSVALARGAIAAGVPVVALGLTGVEGSVPAREFAFLRDGADELGVGLVVHAGETGGPQEVAEAIDVLRSDRIGHGIATVSDPELLARVAALGIVLEVCPSSNVTLGLVPSLEEHPIRTLRDAGVALTVNSDDPPFFATTLTDELDHAIRLLDLDEARLAALQRRALDASFAPASVRNDIHAAIDDWVRAG